MGIYSRKLKQWNRNEIEKLQLERLQKQVKMFMKMFRCTEKEWIKKGIKPEDIKELKDLAKLPFTTKRI